MHNIKWNEISKFDDSEQSPGFLLWKTQLIWRRQIEKTLSEFQLTQPQFVIMASIGYLTANDNIVSQIELANYTLMDINTTSQILRNLEKRGLITCKNKLGNDRTKYSTLTDLGYETLRKAISIVEDFDNKFFGVLPEGGLAKTKEAFSTLIKNNLNK